MKTKRDVEFERILLTYKDQIYRLSISFAQDKELANDLFQEILIRIWSNVEQFKGDSEMGTWIYRIAYNTAVTFSSKEKKRLDQNTCIEPSMEFREPENHSFEIEERFRLLYQAIGELSDSDRIVATLLLEGTSYKTVSEIMGISENYVAVKINRIKSSLTKKLNPSPHGK